MMGRLYDDYKHPEPWDQNLPADLIAPIKHLRKHFDLNHFSNGWVTQKLCYFQLHPDDPIPEYKEFLEPLQNLKLIAGTNAAWRFIGLIKMQTAPATFKAYFELYLDGMTTTAIAIFRELADIGKAHEQRLGVPHLEWADAQTKNLIRSHMHRIAMWIQNVCDKRQYDPNEDSEEQIFWRKWQAPRLLVMEPSRFTPYEPQRNWERFDAEESGDLLEAFSEHYVIYVETRVERIAGQAAVELAKQPRPQPAPASEASTPPEQAPKGESNPYKASSNRRESQKRATQAKYRSWQKEYESLKKSQPNKSDVWYSLQISRKSIGKGSNSETIRKHMKMHK
jgi:hypothetical protein